MKPVFPWLLLLIILLFGGNLLADTDTARKKFTAATELFNNGEFEAAATAFRAAYDADPNWKIMYNLGQCESSARNYGPALEAFEAYLALGGDEVADSRREEVETEIDRLKRLVGFVTVTAPAGTTVMINDMVRGTAPLPGPLAINAGVLQELKVINKDTELLKRGIKVSGGQSITVDVVDSSPANTGPEDSNTDAAETAGAASEEAIALPAGSGGTHRKSPLAPTGIALIITGGATLIAAGVTGGMALGISKDLEKNCPDGKCTGGYQDDNDRMQTLALASTVMYAVGGAVAATGVVLLIVGKKKNAAEKPVAMRPVAGPGFAGITIGGRF